MEAAKEKEKILNGVNVKQLFSTIDLINGAFLRQCLNSKINYTTICHLIEIKN
jgi:hypothetical protein